MSVLRSLDDAARAEEPLVDFIVAFKADVDADAGDDVFNALGIDIEVRRGHWYNDPRIRVGPATAEGVFRLFGIRLRRVMHPTNPVYMWEPNCSLGPLPQSLAPYVVSIGMTQPGADDEGQFYIPLFDR